MDNITAKTSEQAEQTFRNRHDFERILKEEDLLICEVKKKIR